MTDTQADLTERARAIADASIDARVCCDKYPGCETVAWRTALATEIAAALQSERDKAQRDERNSWADQIRGQQKGKTELDLAGIKACAEAALIRPGHVIASAREVLAIIEQLERAQSEREAAIDHLRNALYLFADIHPDYTSKSFRNAVEFYNVARPDRKVEPSGFEPKHFVTESAIQGRCEAAAAEARRALAGLLLLADKAKAMAHRSPGYVGVSMAVDELHNAIAALASPPRWPALGSSLPPAPQEDGN